MADSVKNGNIINKSHYILNLDINYDKENIKKEKIPFQRRSERCEYCGSKIKLVNKARHERTIKCRDGRYLTKIRFEMI